MAGLPSRERMRQKLYPGGIQKDREDVMAVSNAYADGTLSARQEFIDSLDWSAAQKRLEQHSDWVDRGCYQPHPFAKMNTSIIKVIVNAALGEETT